MNDFGWVGPQNAAEVFARYVPKAARVLDAGAGTGLVGQLLEQLGYTNLEAMDLSQGMLDEARKKGVYSPFHRMALGERLDFPSDAFDAVICVGVLTLGHAPANCLYELVRVTRPGGHVVFTMRPDVYENNGFEQIQDELVSAGRWTLEEVTEGSPALPKSEPDVLFQVWAYRVTEN